MKLPSTVQPIRVFVCFVVLCLSFQLPQSGAAEVERTWRTMTWTIDGVDREALVSFPKRQEEKKLAPLTFVFHGHGGTAKRMTGLGFGELWPQSIIVCPQGLPTVTGRDPKGERSGWQTRQQPNEKSHSENRDLLFFDEMLASMLANQAADPNHVFVTGHSNGGGFTYFLFAHRSDKLCAIAPSAAGAGALRDARNAQPLPVMHIAGKADTVVKFANQERTVQMIRRHWGCREESTEYRASKKLRGQQFHPEDKSKAGFIVFVVHAGGHRYHEETPEAVTAFFKSVVNGENESGNEGG
ncbi:MAG: hypothetical protein AAF802_13675 [Planctomycetota bacterium]